MMYKFLFAAFLLINVSGIALDRSENLEVFPVILEPYEHSLIVSQLTIRVTEIPFKLGDTFRKGDLLIKFDNASFKANVVKTEKALAKTIEDEKVKQELLKDHLVSSLDALEAEAAVAAAKYDYETAKQIFDESEIRAPYNGRVAAINIHVFEIPIREKPIMEIFNDSTLIANILLPSHYLEGIKIGDSVFIRLNDTGQVVEAKVKRISPLVNPASSTIKIEAEIDNHDGALKSGMQSQAAFSLNAFEKPNTSFNEILSEMKKDDAHKQLESKP